MQETDGAAFFTERRVAWKSFLAIDAPPRPICIKARRCQINIRIKTPQSAKTKNQQKQILWEEKAQEDQNRHRGIAQVDTQVAVAA